MSSDFISRHIGPSLTEQSLMLKTLGCSNLEELTEKAAPRSLLCQDQEIDLPEGVDEADWLKRVRTVANQNQIFKSWIGQGYYETLTPTVIQRNILENPAWYTSYTPYQAEISQGRMEALLNYQTLITELTAMEIANASLLDEGTALAEAVSMAINLNKAKSQHSRVWVDHRIFKQTLAVLETRAEPQQIEIEQGDIESVKDLSSYNAVVIQYPNSEGSTQKSLEAFCASAKKEGVFVIFVTDLMALCLLKPPGEMGADLVVGSAQRFGVPFGYGGPHAAFLATKEAHKRLLPGRLIGVSKDAEGSRALRLALQTREQHIRREKATSNICTAQVLLAVMASMYAVYHGAEGLKKIATTIRRKTLSLSTQLKRLGFDLAAEPIFDTVKVKITGDESQQLKRLCEEEKYNLFWADHAVTISVDEGKSWQDLETLIRLFAQVKNQAFSGLSESQRQLDLESMSRSELELSLIRKSEYLKQNVFNSYHSETELLRYIFRLQSKDLSLTHSMIPLGSCTMKLNSTTEMMPVTWPEFSAIHPFAPQDQAKGYHEMIRQLETWLVEITGFDAISLQPNAGSQGEYAGLLVIRKYHLSRGEGHRRVCLIPSSAHGTNPASAIMAGMTVVGVQCDDQGNIDIADLQAKADQYKSELAALMITYPSTHGVFEEGLREICSLIHDRGGQVYMDGANFNALVGIARPGQLGIDVCHLNLHKTFCIPHGGGGPGVGPIGVAAHLKNLLPTHPLVGECNPSPDAIGPVCSAPWGSAGILPISWSYIGMMGKAGLKQATQVAILSANYIAHRLKDHYPILYTGQNGMIAHECILDVRPFKELANITVDDIAKRLMDYSFHAPTMSWPVSGTLMVEPTESESLEELDRFIDAMISIREEIQAIADGKMHKDDNPLRHAPHTVECLTKTEWTHSYTREQASYPRPWVKERKFWPSVARVDNAYGDRNLFCSCS